MVEGKDTLLDIYESIGRTKSALQERDYAVAQGALTAVFNTLGKLIHNSQFLDQEKKDRLMALGEFVYDTRNGLVTQIEVNHRTLEGVIQTNHLYERLDTLREVLWNYVNKWYQS